MKTSSSTTELRKLSLEDLEKEIVDLQNTVSKKKLALDLGAEKNSAVFKQERKQLARLKTIATQKKHETLKDESKTSTVPASKKKKASTSASTNS